MGKHYSHLTLEERCTIAQLQQAGYPQCQIAAALDRSPSSISRELRRNSGRQVGYKPSYAQQQTRARRWHGSRLERDEELCELVLGQLARGWSPEQIAGRLKQQKAAVTISHESIYRFIYRQIRRTNDGAWRHLLPRGKYRRGRRARHKRPAEDLIKRRVSIALRPLSVATRRVFGHWEGDLMAFATPGQAILVAHERKSRVTIGARQPGKASKPLAKRLHAWFQQLDRRLRRSLTIDNGSEFAQHHVLTDHLDMRTFFCDPHSPWQKGGVENAIGRLRRFLPRKTNLDTITPRLLDAAIAAYNNTPRKCLQFRSPAEVFLSTVLRFECESTPSLRSG
ncbi:MAG: IS30 family transposase [Alphaproteobacteria bacterium]|nr:IS30 family transposase [Alphaproteobacteria bacterium]MCW5738829.1 IS30 family transposase [Alphaproteobacteria bacterium]